jgi:hypothetical protein
MITKFKIFEQIELDPYGEENWGPDKVEVEIFVPKISEEKKESFWYYGEGVIASATYLGNEVEIIPRGEIRVQFKNNGEWYNNEKAVEEATRRSYTDDNIREMYDKWWFGNNNWFEINFVGVDDFGEIEFDYDSAIQRAKFMVKNEL